MCSGRTFSSSSGSTSVTSIAEEIPFMAFFSEMSSESTSLWVGQMTSPASSDATSVARTYPFFSSSGFSRE